MKINIIHAAETKPFIDGVLEGRKLLNEEETENMSVSLLKLNGTNKKIKDRGSDACYFIIEGAGTFNIEGKEYRVIKGDLVTIPKNTAYFDSGKMTMIVFRNPRYNPENIEVLS